MNVEDYLPIREVLVTRWVSVDRTGAVAVAKVEVRYQDRRYTDYLTLQKTAAGWSIVNKAFFSQD